MSYQHGSPVGAIGYGAHAPTPRREGSSLDWCDCCWEPWPCGPSKDIEIAYYKQQNEQQLAAQAQLVERYRAVLQEVADDNDPRDGCAYSEAARQALTEEGVDGLPE